MESTSPVRITMPSSQWSYKLFEITTTMGQKITGIFKQPKQPASSIQFVYEDQLEMFPETNWAKNNVQISFAPSYILILPPPGKNPADAHAHYFSQEGRYNKQAN